jgi:hypothetical protein
MKKTEAITLHLKHWNKFPVFVWQEDDQFVTEVDGKVVRASNVFSLDTKLDGIAPKPRNLYFIDEPDYETNLPNAPTQEG